MKFKPLNWPSIFTSSVLEIAHVFILGNVSSTILWVLACHPPKWIVSLLLHYMGSTHSGPGNSDCSTRSHVSWNWILNLQRLCPKGLAFMALGLSLMLSFFSCLLSEFKWIPWVLSVSVTPNWCSTFRLKLRVKLRIQRLLILWQKHLLSNIEILSETVSELPGGGRQATVDLSIFTISL